MTEPASSAWWRFVIAVGNYFFRARNAVFPILIALSVLVLRPSVTFGSPAVDRLWTWIGVAVALAGEAVRLFTIGFDYIERGGKNKQIHASFLAQRGMYGLTRNPMYIGNILIATGVTMVAGSPSMALTILPLFLFVYYALVTAEEAYLRPRFGPDYAKYADEVPRWWPAWHRAGPSFANMDYDWRRAFRKDMGTIVGLLTGLILLPVWRTLFLHGFSAARAKAVVALCWEAVVLLAYAGLHHLKKNRRLFYLQANPRA